MAITTPLTDTQQHDKDHFGSDHNFDGTNVLLGSSAGVGAEIDWDQNAATADTVVVRKSSTGDVIVPSTPTADDAAVSKAYADGLVSGLKIKDACRLATIAVLPFTPAYTTSNTLTAQSVGVLAVDGIDTIFGDRILVKDQVSGIENGIWEVTTAGTVGVAYILERTGDFAVGSSAASAFTFIGQGGTLDETGWACTNTTAAGDIVGTDALTFTQFTGAGTIIGGDGIQKTGNTLDIEPSDFAGAGLESTGSVPAQDIRIATQGTGIAGGGGTDLSFDATAADGNGLSGSGAVLTVETDDTSVATLEVGTSGVRIASTAAGDGLTGGSGSALAVQAITPSGNVVAVDVTSGGVGLDVDDIDGVGIEADGSGLLDVSAQGDGLTGGGGTVLAVEADTTGGANLAEAINVSANGVAVKIDDVSVKENASGQLSVDGFKGFQTYAGTKPVFAGELALLTAVNDWAWFTRAGQFKMYMVFRRVTTAGDATDYSMVQLT